MEYFFTPTGWLFPWWFSTSNILKIIYCASIRWPPVTWTEQCWVLELWQTTRNHGSWPNARCFPPFTTSFQLWSRHWVCRATKCYHYLMTSVSSLQLPQLNHVHSSSWCNVWVLQYNVAMQLASWELCLLSGTNFFTFSIDRYTL